MTFRVPVFLFGLRATQEVQCLPLDLITVRIQEVSHHRYQVTIRGTLAFQACEVMVRTHVPQVLRGEAAIKLCRAYLQTGSSPRHFLLERVQEMVNLSKVVMRVWWQESKESEDYVTENLQNQQTASRSETERPRARYTKTNKNVRKKSPGFFLKSNSSEFLSHLTFIKHNQGEIWA